MCIYMSVCMCMCAYYILEHTTIIDRLYNTDVNTFEDL